jgi:hypothetical protein
MEKKKTMQFVEVYIIWAIIGVALVFRNIWAWTFDMIPLEAILL